MARGFALDDQEVSGFLHENNRTVVLQDVVALDKPEQVIASEPAGTQELRSRAAALWAVDPDPFQDLGNASLSACRWGPACHGAPALPRGHPVGTGDHRGSR